MHTTVRDYVIDYETARKLVKAADRSQLKYMDNNRNMKYLLRVRIHMPTVAMAEIESLKHFNDVGLGIGSKKKSKTFNEIANP